MSEVLFNQILQELTGIKCDLTELKADVSQLTTDVTELKTDVAELKNDVAELKTDVAGLKTDVAQLNTRVSELENDVSGLKTELSLIKTDMVLMKEQVNENTQLLKALEHNTEEHTAQLHSISEKVTYLYQDNTHVKTELIRHGDLLKVISIRTAEQDAEIWRLKRATS